MAVALTGGDIEAAEDLVQSALARCWLRWTRVSAADNPPAYAKRTLYSIFISERRRHRPGEILGSVPDMAGRPDHGVDLDMLAAIRQLPARQRAVIVARYLDDLSEKDAAQQLRCTVGTIKSQTFKALRTLRHSQWLADDPHITTDKDREARHHG